jgi:hypothetical protein
MVAWIGQIASVGLFPGKHCAEKTAVYVSRETIAGMLILSRIAAGFEKAKSANKEKS